MGGCTSGWNRYTWRRRCLARWRCGRLDFVLNAAFGNMFAGLAWCIGVPLMTLIFGGLFLKETKDVRIWEEITSEPAPGESASMPRAGTGVGPTIK